MTQFALLGKRALLEHDMASVRLTKTMKEDIKNTLITRATGEEEIEFTRQAGLLLQKVSEYLWGSVYQHVVQIYNYDPEMVDNRMYLRLTGFSNIGYPNKTIYYTCAYSAPWPKNGSYWVDCVDLSEDMKNTVLDFARKHFEKEERHADIKRQISSFVESCTTFAKLYEAFPELRELAAQLEPANMPSTTTGLPSVQIAALKDILKLPSEKYQETVA